MAAKNLRQIFNTVDIRAHMKAALCIGPMCDVHERIDIGAKLIEERIIGELRDFFAHEVMRMDGLHTPGIDYSPTAKALFDKVFADIQPFTVSTLFEVSNEEKKKGE